MCRHAAAHLASDLTSINLARQLVRRCLDEWEVDDTNGTVVLLVSELVANAVIHARSDVELVVAVAEGVVEVGVGDSDPRVVPGPGGRRELQQPAVWTAETGRGLYLVDAMADEWGTEHLGHGKEVWFRVAVDEEWADRTACPCHGAELHDTVVLRSGRRVTVAAPT